jgi:hypothetical protein
MKPLKRKDLYARSRKVMRKINLGSAVPTEDQAPPPAQPGASSPNRRCSMIRQRSST